MNKNTNAKQWTHIVSITLATLVSTSLVTSANASPNTIDNNHKRIVKSNKKTKLDHKRNPVAPSNSPIGSIYD